MYANWVRSIYLLYREMAEILRRGIPGQVRGGRFITWQHNAADTKQAFVAGMFTLNIAMSANNRKKVASVGSLVPRLPAMWNVPPGTGRSRSRSL